MSFRNEFSHNSGVIHLNNAGAAPLTLKARETIRRLVDLQTERGALIAPAFYGELDQARTTLARFLNAKDASHVAFTANLATSVSQVALSLPLHEGDIILTIDQEYPSNAYPWIAVAKFKKLKIESFSSNSDFSIDWENFIQKIRPGIKVVALSWVQYKAGTTAPLQKIAQACHAVGAWFVVDGIQALGVLPFDLQESGVDIICGGTHKWLCGLTGQGFLGFRDELYMQMIPVIQGTMTYGGPDDPVRADREPLASARRFESGAPGHVAAISTAASLEVLMQYGVANISKHALQLRQALAQGLHDQGWTILGDPQGSPTSAILTFTGNEIQKVAQILTDKQVSHVLRSHGLRLSPHGFNTAEEIEQVLKWIGSSVR